MSTPRVELSERVVIGVASDGDAFSLLLECVEAAGATAEPWTIATAIAKGAEVDAVVLDLGAAPETFLPLIAALDRDLRTRWLPRVLVVDDAVSATRLAPFGPGIIVGANGPRAALMTAVGRALELVRSRRESERRTEDLRTIERTLTVVQRDAVTLSHDARVLFGVILGFGANLRDGFAGPITEDQRQHVQNMLEASSDAAALLERYVEVLRRSLPRTLDTNAHAPARLPTRQHLDVAELVQGIVALFEAIATTKQIRLTHDGSRAIYAWCDALRMKQAIVNLVSNALKFTPAGGNVLVSVRLGPPPSMRNGVAPKRDVEIVVTDTGPGIPESERRRVFEAGVRLDRDRTTPGTGQGLAIVREVADLHGGDVRAEEGPDGGAAITLVIPSDRRGRSGEHPAVSASAGPPPAYSAPPPSAPRWSDFRREPE